MSKITVSVEVEEKSYQVAEAIKGLIKSTKDALADGFQPGQDIPAIIGQNLSGLLVAVSDLSSLPGEAAEDTEAFMKAWGLAGLELAGLFLKKSQPVAPAVAPAPQAVPAPEAAPVQ